jgi:uncharacterized membrane protein
VPVALTVTLIIWIINKFDDILNLQVPGLGFVIIIVMITFIGFLASNYFGQKIFALIDRVFARLPIVK